MTDPLADAFSDVPTVADAPPLVAKPALLTDALELVAPKVVPLPTPAAPDVSPSQAPPAAAPGPIVVTPVLAARLESAVWRHSAMVAQYKAKEMAVELAYRAFEDAKADVEGALQDLREARVKLGELAREAGVDPRRQWTVNGEKGTIVYNDPPAAPRGGMRMPDGTELKTADGKTMPRPKDPKA